MGSSHLSRADGEHHRHKPEVELSNDAIQFLLDRAKTLLRARCRAPESFRWKALAPIAAQDGWSGAATTFEVHGSSTTEGRGISMCATRLAAHSQGGVADTQFAWYHCTTRFDRRRHATSATLGFERSSGACGAWRAGAGGHFGQVMPPRGAEKWFGPSQSDVSPSHGIGYMLVLDTDH